MFRDTERKGITLIELLIVVLILAALSAVAIPRISQSANNAKKNACHTNIDILNSAIEMYNADESAYPTNLSTLTGNTTYFPDGAPTCALGTAYSNTLSNNRVNTTGHSH